MGSFRNGRKCQDDCNGYGYLEKISKKLEREQQRVGYLFEGLSSGIHKDITEFLRGFRRGSLVRDWRKFLLVFNKFKPTVNLKTENPEEKAFRFRKVCVWTF